MKKPIECKSEDGITVGIIDAILILFNLLKPRLEEIPPDKDNPVIQASMDLEDDENFEDVIEHVIDHLNQLRDTGLLPFRDPTLEDAIKASKRYLKSLEERYARGER